MSPGIRRKLLPIGVASTAVLMILAQNPAASADSGDPVPPPGATSGPPGNEGSADDPSANTQQYDQARNAPGIVSPGAYGAAFAQLQKLGHTSGDWQHVTNKVYNADDPRYRDYDSNSSGGAGNVTGRVTGTAADDNGHVYVGGANGGVWRSSVGGGHWTPISDKLPSQATGDLMLDPRGRLWLGTGEANTASDTVTGSGVYVLSHPESGTFSPGDRVGGDELQSTSIRHLRIIGNRVYAATTRGLWSHPLDDLKTPWTLEFAPSPAFLPGGPQASNPLSIYKNLVNDVAADPKDPSKIIVAAGWRSGDTSYNGFYTKTNGVWTLISAGLGDLPTTPANVGAVTFARSADGSKFYAIQQDPTTISSPKSTLGGVYEADGTPFGPWHKVADSAKLEGSGSAETGSTYNPGIQAWYNQFLTVDPSDPNHVYAGLEEVFESHDGGQTWNTVGPYWNFTFACWSVDPTKQTGDCNQTPHSDQHAVAIGSYHGKSYVVVGNDGGAYKRPLTGSVDASGHATDWQSLNDGTIDTLQYYSVGVGKDASGHGVDVSGGLQDNGQSILKAGDKVMGSNFGGDGGFTMVDPNNGCNIVEEYTNLSMWVTNDCGQNVSTDYSTSTEYFVAPNDGQTGNARFIAPFTSDQKNPATWVAGGEHVAVQTQGFAIRDSSAWTDVYDLGPGHQATAVAASGGRIYAAWVGGGGNPGASFSRGIAVGNADGTGWRQLNLPADGVVPNRFLDALAIDPKDSDHVYLAVNGYSRKWVEGPGAGVGHVFETHDGGTTWSDISADMPDIPADSIQILPDGGLAVGTDLAVLYRAPGKTKWKVLGENLPTNATTQVLLGPDGRLYAATHGRGIWAIKVSDGDD